MTDEFTYDVICKDCLKKFTVEMFGTESRNIFLANNKDWYCDDCKKKYFKEKAHEMNQAQNKIGYSELAGTEKQISWALKIRAELINKAEYLKGSLKFSSEEEKALSDKAFQIFFEEWKDNTKAKWWIDNRKMTVRDISTRLSEITKEIES